MNAAPVSSWFSTVGSSNPVLFVVGPSGKGKSLFLDAYEKAPCVLEFTISGDGRALAVWSAATPAEMLSFLQTSGADAVHPERVLDVEQGEAGLTVSVVLPAPVREKFLAQLHVAHPDLLFEVVERGRLMGQPL